MAPWTDTMQETLETPNEFLALVHNAHRIEVRGDSMRKNVVKPNV
jgi:hypothetical protein